MKTIIRIQPISKFSYKNNFKIRTEIEYYSDRTSAVAQAVYSKI